MRGQLLQLRRQLAKAQAENEQLWAALAEVGGGGAVGCWRARRREGEEDSLVVGVALSTGPPPLF